MNADNIYKVLDLPTSTNLDEANYERSSAILLTWLFQINQKCSTATDWDSVTYADFVQEILDFDYHHEHKDSFDHHDDSVSPEQFEAIIREINETYSASSDCNSPDAWVNKLTKEYTFIIADTSTQFNQLERKEEALSVVQSLLKT